MPNNLIKKRIIQKWEEEECSFVTPLKINHPDKTGSKIMKIKSGMEFCVAIDQEGRLITWGQE